MTRITQRRSRRPPPRTRAMLKRHLETLRRFRDIPTLCALLWPEDTRIVHSVIDHTYGLAPEELPDGYIEARSRLEHHTHMLESLLEEDA